MAKQVRFAHKVTALVVALILLSGLGITLLTSLRFRRELYAHESNSTFTVYMAAANYLTAHYKTHRGKFERRTLDYVFDQKFLRIEGIGAQELDRRPSRIRVYDAWGRLLYDYPPGGDTPASVAREQLPRAYRQDYVPGQDLFEVAGPVSSQGEVPAYVFITIPSEMRREVRALYLASFGMMFAVVLVAIAISLIATGRTLAPVESLTEAARNVRRGDLRQRVEVASKDEIGLLAETFNDMVSSMARRVDMMHHMLDWAVMMSRELDMTRLYKTVVDVCTRLSGAQSCHLYLFDEKEGKLRVEVRHDEDAAGTCDESLLQEAWARGRAVFSMGVQVGREHGGSAMEMAVPLQAGRKRRGVVWVGRRPDQHPYEEEMLTALQSMVQHASVAIDNAALYRELAEKERFEQEMRLARRIQQYMLPREVPRLEGYDAYGISIPAYEVGGDYFDYVHVSGNRWHFVIGDVSGKGVAAGLIMSIVRALLRTYVEFEPSPRNVLSMVNRSLASDLESDMFVTMADIALDAARHRARIVRAGHEPVLVIRASGTVEHLTPHGTALGLVGLDQFDGLMEESELEIAPHDTVLLYTDGVTEAHDRRGEEFGPVRLEELARRHAGAPAQELVETIVAEVQRFVGKEEHQDDITLVALRRDGT